MTTWYTRTGSEMFLTECSPRYSYANATLNPPHLHSELPSACAWPVPLSQVASPKQKPPKGRESRQRLSFFHLLVTHTQTHFIRLRLCCWVNLSPDLLRVHRITLFSENTHILYVFNLARNFGLRLFVKRQYPFCFQGHGYGRY